MHYVYALCNPLLEEDHPEYVFYVGECSNVIHRLGTHLSQNSNRAKMAIIRSIFDQIGMSPKVAVLEECTYESRLRRERFWQNYYLKINPLLTSREHIETEDIQYFNTKDEVQILNVVQAYSSQYSNTSMKALYNGIKPYLKVSLDYPTFRHLVYKWREQGLL